MWAAASVAAAQINTASQASTPFEGITVSLTVAIAAGAVMLGCAWKVASVASQLAADVRELRNDLEAREQLQDERHKDNLRRLENLERQRR